MKNVLIIVANYSLNPSSVANCMKPLIEKLAEKHHVDVLTDRKRTDIPAYDKVGNVHVHRVNDLRIMNTIRVNELTEMNSSMILKVIMKLYAFISKAIYFVRYTLFAFEKISGGWQLNRVFNKVNQLDEKFSYDMVISASLPFQSHLIAEKLKDKKSDKIKWIVFEFDPFAFNDEIKVSHHKRMKMSVVESRVFSHCDCLIFTPELAEFYNKKDFVVPSSKVHSLSFANMEKMVFSPTDDYVNFLNEDKINCLFAGRLYDDIRNPSALLQLFAGLDRNIQLTLMTNMSTDRIKAYSPPDYQPNVVPFQMRDTALFNLMNAHMLVNIGNTVEFQVPGKIFEYMSTGKPIIHFSKIEDDPALKYLNRYENVFVVNEWDKDFMRCREDLESFCYNHKDVHLDFDDVNRQLGEYSKDVIIERFLRIFNDLLEESNG